MPKISVLMPVYNTPEEYLREAMESILNQTYEDFEFIILNDGSTNNSEDVIKSYNDKRIKYYKNEKNEGLIFSRNKLLDIAKGKYIAHLDSDDIALPERFQKQVDFLEAHSEISLLGTWMEIFPEKEIITKEKYPTLFDMIRENQFMNSSVMYNREVFQKYNLTYNSEFIVAEDYDLWSRAINHIKTANLQEILIKYRSHGNNISKSKQDLMLKMDKTVKQNMLNFLTSNENHQSKILQMLQPSENIRNINKNKVYILGIPVLSIEEAINE